VNAVPDRMHRWAARPAISVQHEDTLDALATGGQPIGDPSASIDTTLDVQAALSMLVPDQPMALVLVDLLGHSIGDAAEALGVSQGVVKSRAARGRARLLPRLAHHHDAVPDQGRAADRTAITDCPVLSILTCEPRPGRYRLPRQAPATGTQSQGGPCRRPAAHAGVTEDRRGVL
jgi:hypothetical protein